MPSISAPHKLAVLIFIKNNVGEHLLLLRSKTPNKGNWSPIGGKLETGIGESPFECARRETMEECGLHVEDKDLHLFAMIAEKGYEDSSHWLLFLFDCRKPMAALPPAIDEGGFGFHSREAIEALNLPPADRDILWPLYDKHHRGFASLRLDFNPALTLNPIFEQIL